jgi:anti-anti-sigma regulatory factor
MKKGGDVKLVKLSPKVREELVMVRLHEIFDIFEDETSAVGSF